MKKSTLTLMTFLLLAGCGDYNSSLNEAPLLDADSGAGKTVFDTYNCAVCHGEDGSVMALGVSRIITQIDTVRDIENALYTLQSQPSDRDQRMKDIAQELTPQEIVDVAAYVESLKN